MLWFREKHEAHASLVLDISSLSVQRLHQEDEASLDEQGIRASVTVCRRTA